jgi:hypothetical protein
MNFPENLYVGSAWWSLTFDCIQHIAQYVTENPEVYKRFKFTQLPDELFFQTIIMNSPFAKNVQNNNLRHLKFFPEGSSYAAEIDESDLPFLDAESVLIARKFSINTLHLIEKK